MKKYTHLPNFMKHTDCKAQVERFWAHLTYNNNNNKALLTFSKEQKPLLPE